MRFTSLLLISAVLLFVGHVSAQQRLRVATASVPNATPGKFYYVSEHEPARAVEFEEGVVASDYFITNINRYFNIPAEFTFLQSEENTDDIGMRHRFLQQHYNGIPIEGLGYRVHERNASVRSANGKAIRKIALDTRTEITEDLAFSLALRFLKSKDTVFRHPKKLIVSKGFTFKPGSFVVAWQFDIDVSLAERWRISVNARTGEIVNKVSLVNSCDNERNPPLPYSTATGLTPYYGRQTVRVEKLDGYSRLVGQTEHGGMIGTYDFHNASLLALLFGLNVPVYDFTSDNNEFNHPYQKVAVSVQWGVEKSYEYYLTKHGRNSFDNNGGAIRSYVHVDYNLDNAFWTGRVLAFGDGSNNNPLVELDVVGHELTHGVTQYEAGLQYYYESGALNESFSDIFGKAIEFNTFGDTATWILSKHFREGGLRNFANPNLQMQPDTYQGHLWFTGADDNGGVHYNSGVQNFWFYLLCVGGSGVNDHQFNYSVNAIGMETAAKIAYRNLSEYLMVSSDYFDSRIGSMLATADLYGTNSHIHQQVDHAWDAVGVIDEPIIQSVSVEDITATTAKITGSLLPRGEHVTYRFDYGTSPALGSSTNEFEYVDKVDGMITGLLPDTKYYFRLVATNERGSSSFNGQPFTTISLRPLVKLQETVDITETTVRLHGKVNANSLPTSYRFDYGTTPSMGSTTASYPIAGLTEFVDVSVSVAGLQPRSTYYYKLVASNASGPVSTEFRTFFTAVKPEINSFAPLTAPVESDLVIYGNNFNPVAGKNIVAFGATVATVISSNATEIRVKVPRGASLGPISVTDAESGLTDESVRDFVPTFNGGFTTGSLQYVANVNDTYVTSVLIEDMDRDGKPDIIARHYPGFSVSQNINQGGPITSESFIRNTYTADFNSDFMYLADLDGNGQKDVIAGSQEGFRIYPNLSVPGFIFFGVPVYVPTGGWRDVVFSDFDHDGHIDIATFSYLPGDSTILKVFRNENPKGSLSGDNFVRRYQQGVPYSVYYLHADDLNNDGRPDLVAGAATQTFAAIFTNNSAPGLFDFEASTREDNGRSYFTRYSAQDFNQDGLRDIISHAVYQVGNLSLLQNASVAAEIVVQDAVTLMNDKPVFVVQPGDVNGDGKVDLLAGTYDGRFTYLKNLTPDGGQLSAATFERSDYGQENPNAVQSIIVVNDLNGDGRPEVINKNVSSNGYAIEVWQNVQNNCVDPSLITITPSVYTATLHLPANTTVDQFEIQYGPASANYWWQGFSTTLQYLNPGETYKMRVRGLCDVGFSAYHYFTFSTTCIDANSFEFTDVGNDRIYFYAADIGYYEIQYSISGKGTWMDVPQYATQIGDLLPGTEYDLRFRGRCATPGEYQYRKFITLCPELSSLIVVNIKHNQADVSWSSAYSGDIVVEYSPDNLNWNLVGPSRRITGLTPGQNYIVRGRMVCTNINSSFVEAGFTTPCPKTSALNIRDITPVTATVSWSDVSNTGQYIVSYSRSAGGPRTTVETNSTSILLEGLYPGTLYTVHVAPECVGEQDYTSATFKTLCYVPLNFTVHEITTTTAEFSWEDEIGSGPYFVEYSISGRKVSTTIETTSTSIVLSDLRPGTLYEAKLRIECLSEQAPQVSRAFTTDLYEETTFAPNPTQSLITIYPSKDLIGKRYTMVGSTGKKEAEGLIDDYTLDLSGLPAGIYVLKIEGENPAKILKY